MNFVFYFKYIFFLRFYCYIQIGNILASDNSLHKDSNFCTRRSYKRMDLDPACNSFMQLWNLHFQTIAIFLKRYQLKIKTKFNKNYVTKLQVQIVEVSTNEMIDFRITNYQKVDNVQNNTLASFHVKPC